PSQYIGIGENGFRAIEPSAPEDDDSLVVSYGSEFGSARGSVDSASWIAFFVVFGGVTAMLGYFFFSN
ncbi:MAG: hypothetical protein WA793_15480, partial [Sphingorhabdus sp.]|uniref:hypothetical protein n=1 Tax=Sphingorhabdus sp. TaxID=1902408 RepID=UPI003C9B22D7